ncbi:MAG: alanine racemase [Anaerolineales bacterium]|nr:alanine racemase [Anaerolineales bacterium]MCB9127481.1 alanine racemase [Ardenticatenales bacterium]MCB9172186.1 alanine racemase [Ardenticatenales bacterium]
MADELPPLTPLTLPWMHETLDDREQINRLFAQYGSPLNLHHLGPFRQNFADYAALLDDLGLDHLIFFARKANKCRAFAAEAGRLGHGVDTASYRELEQALALGVPPERLVLTAAIKARRLIELAVANDVPIMIDNRDECELIDSVAQQHGKQAEVGLRISGFNVDGERLYSRFGVPVDEAVDFIVGVMGQQCSHLRFTGLHFHLNGYSRHERGAALSAAIDVADSLKAQGIETRYIDIGGGLLVRYLAQRNEWEQFMAALRDAQRGRRAPITFGNMGLGLQLIDGELHGEPTVYPYYNETAKVDFLAEVLAHQAPSGGSVAQMLQARDIQIRMEPGRSLLDQCGMTVARVAFRKWDSRGELLVGLEMNRTQLFSSSADFLLDPILIHHPPNPEPDHGLSGYFVGAYCLEQDVILKRKIRFQQMPAIGDWVAFPNSAGYMMHFYESEAHLFELATNLVAADSTNRFVLDDPET